MGYAELCSGVSTLVSGAVEFYLQLPARRESTGSWAFLTYLLACPDPAFGKAEVGVPPSVLGCSVQPLLPWEPRWGAGLGIPVLQQRRKGMESPWPCVQWCCSSAGVACTAF